MTHHTYRIATALIINLAFAMPTIAAVTTYTNKSAWQSAVGTWTTIHFNELPANTLVTDQYADLGVVFTDGSDYTLYAPTAFPNDNYGLNGAFDEIAVAFDSPMGWIAVHFPGLVKFKLYNQGELIYTSPTFGQLSYGNFAGLVTETPFDAAIISDPMGDVFIDDLHFGGPVPAPVGLALMAAAALFAQRRRRIG